MGMESTLTPAEREFWEKNHYLVRKGAYAGPALAALLAWADELAAWPESPGQWMKYFERTAQNDRQLCRIENFLEFHESLRDIIQGDEALATLAELMGEEAVLFKEKINYKLPGGAGFLAHQDAPAFTSFQQRYHVTMLVTVDAMTISNGCLEVGGAVPVYEILPQEADGTVAKEEEEARDWQPLEIPAGSVVFFDSYIPHRSQRNQSDVPRRALYITYNRKSEGERRADYYADKRRVFPPECEREEGVDYGSKPGPYNLGNPIR